MTRPRILCLCVLFALVALPGQARKRSQPTQLSVSSRGIPEELLLDVGIELFESGLASDEEPEEGSVEQWKANPGIRRSESVFMPFHLKTTLEATGYWGAVRVVPPGSHGFDVLVSGVILKSSPSQLELQLRFRDATGRTHVPKVHRYELGKTGAFPEAVEGVPRREPYQNLYNQIANELAGFAVTRDAKQVKRIREIAELKFAAELSPELFGDYLGRGRRGQVALLRLPAEDDPMVERMRRIRERDHLLVDTLNEYYADFYDSMKTPYWDWREFSQQEFLAWKKVRRQARTRKILGGLLLVGGIATDEGGLSDAAVIGGIETLRSGISKGKGAKIHADALGELAASFDSEVAPVFIEVEGRVVKLEGTARAKYASWRGLLKDIFAEESGLAPQPMQTDADQAGAVNTQR